MSESVISPNSVPYIVKIVRTPARFIGYGYPFWRGPVDGDGKVGSIDIDPGFRKLTTVDLRELRPLSGLRGRERYTTGETRRIRLRSGKRVPMGVQFLWTLYNQTNWEGLWWLYNQGLIGDYVCSDTVFRDQSGDRAVLDFFLRPYGGGWEWQYNPSDSDRGPDDPVLGLRAIQ